MKNKFLLLLAATVLSVSAAFATSISTISPLINKVKDVSITKDMYGDVVAYMDAHDIAVVSGYQIEGTENYHVTDTYGLNYIVYIENGVVKGMSEVDF